ncbi:MAG: hypothetical protein D3908_04985 [Candidatus Electrothrix sp. AUS4]|nr:hypothetical protein [Candidatus Electrothrix sp. AUS4]
MFPACDYGRWCVEVAMLLTYVREAIRSLYTAKQRTLLALIGISIAIGAVIALVSIGIIWGGEMMRKYSDLNPDVLHVWEHWEKKSKKGITVEDTFSLLENTRTLADVVPVISDHVNFFFNGQRGSTSLKGTTATYQKMNNLSLQLGRFISDLDSNKSYAVIGPEVLNEPGFNTFKGDLVGSSIKLNNMSYTIIGVLEDREFDWETRRSIIIPISTIISSPFRGLKYL